MAKYFDQFPTTPYRIDRYNSPLVYGLPTNIMFRMRVFVEKLDQVFHYYEYTVRDGETPEILAEKLYKNPEAHWLILMTNNITDPVFDWVMDYDTFNKYIIGKYGSIATAQATTHHYEKIIQTRDSDSDTLSNVTIQITQSEYSNLSPTATSTTYTVGDYTVDLYSDFRNSVSCYDWEWEENEKRRVIKIIKRDYYPLIMAEFERIVGKDLRSSIYRKLT